MKSFLVICVLATICQASYFPNPILTKNHSPSVKKVNGTYYMVTRSEHFPYNLPVYSSNDLISWKFENYVFQSRNSPTWVEEKKVGNDNRLIGVYAPEIRQINKDSFNVYFHGRLKDAEGFGLYAIGVATAATPTGPYVDLGKPLYAPDTSYVEFPNVVLEGPSMYLIYSKGGYPPDDYWAVKLSSDGLEVISNYSEIVIYNTEKSIYSSYHMKHDNVDYILFQDNTGSLKVARSFSGLFGPYEHRQDPLIPGYYAQPCVVRSVGNDEDVLIFDYSISPSNGDGVYAASLGWEDGWPIIKR